MNRFHRDGSGGGKPPGTPAAGRNACPIEGKLTRGSALLTVLWLSAALAAIAFSLSMTVRGEMERTATAVDGLRSYYLAAGGVEWASVDLLSSMMYPDRAKIQKGWPNINYKFATGDVNVEIIPETSKLDVNNVPVEELYRLVVALGYDPDRAREVALGIDDWRRLNPDSAAAPDMRNPGLSPSFRPAHASLQEIEELLQVRGITPEMFYGTYVPAPANAPEGGPRLIPRPGLMDCLSVYGSRDRLDINTAQPAVLAAAGLGPDTIHAILEQRRMAPFNDQQMSGFVQSVGGSAARLRVGGNSVFTMRSTAVLRLADGSHSDLKRTVAAMVKYMPPGYDTQIHVLRWYDTAWSN